MTAVAPTYLSPYELRLSLVVAELRQSDVPDAAASALAEKILRSLDHIPEKLR